MDIMEVVYVMVGSLVLGLVFEALRAAIWVLVILAIFRVMFRVRP